MRLLAITMTLLAALAGMARAQSTQPSTRPAIALQAATEEGKKIIRATVTLDGKPLENVRVEFAAQRSFGQLSLGHDDTLDDGTAVVPFPVDLPGDSRGQIKVMASLTAPARYSDVRAAAILGGAGVMGEASEPFPRALWAPHAPLALIASILGILAIVWFTYAYVLAQIVAIARRR